MPLMENETGTVVAPLNGGFNAELKADLRKPRDVLRDMMIFYDKQAKDIITDIIIRLKEDMTRGTASELAFMYKKFSESADVAIRCAEKLAPYEHPKLESIEVKKELTHRFVVRAPSPTIDVKAWVGKAREEQAILASRPGHDVAEVDVDVKPDPLAAAIYTTEPHPKIAVSVFDPDFDDDEYFPDELPDDDDIEDV